MSGRPYKTIDDLPGREFTTLTRSTIPLLSYWQRIDVRHVLSQQLGLVDINDADHEFEHATPVRKPGRGKASMTDLLLRSNRTAIAIEAKWNEPRYPTVHQWKSQGHERNKGHVLRHWLHMLEGFCEQAIDQSAIGGVVYQLLHRSASACRAAGPHRSAVVLYLIFGEDTCALNAYRAQLKTFYDAIRPTRRLRIVGLHVSLARTAAFDTAFEITSRIDDHSTTEVNRRAVRDHALFLFEPPKRIFDTQSHTDELWRAIVPIVTVDRHAAWSVIGTGFVIGVLNPRSALVMTAAHLLDHPSLKEPLRSHASALPALVGEVPRRKPVGTDIHAIVGPITERYVATIEGAWYRPEIDIALFLMTLPENAPCQFDLKLSIDTAPLAPGTRIFAMGYSGAEATFAEPPDYERALFRVSLKIPLIGRHGSVLAAAPYGSGIYTSPGVFVDCAFDSGMSGGPVVELRDGVAVVRGVIGGDVSDGPDMDVGTGARAFANVLAPCLTLRALGIELGHDDGSTSIEPSIEELIERRVIDNRSGKRHTEQ